MLPALPYNRRVSVTVRKRMKEFSKAPTTPDVAGLTADELESSTIERLVPAKRGGWWVIPKDVADHEQQEGGILGWSTKTQTKVSCLHYLI